jgi:hypothetical protein
MDNDEVLSSVNVAVGVIGKYGYVKPNSTVWGVMSSRLMLNV